MLYDIMKTELLGSLGSVTKLNMDLWVLRYVDLLTAKEQVSMCNIIRTYLFDYRFTGVAYVEIHRLVDAVMITNYSEPLEKLSVLRELITVMKDTITEKSYMHNRRFREIVSEEPSLYTGTELKSLFTATCIRKYVVDVVKSLEGTRVNNLSILRDIASNLPDIHLLWACIRLYEWYTLVPESRHFTEALIPKLHSEINLENVKVTDFKDIRRISGEQQMLLRAMSYMGWINKARG